MAITDALKARAIELNSKIAIARNEYYVLNAPTMSDADYDALEKELADLVAEHAELVPYASTTGMVGSDVKFGQFTVPHAQPMLSLENTYTIDELMSRLEALPDGVNIVEEPKVDGASGALRFEDGHLVLALTRGDGAQGTDVTLAVMSSASIPKQLRPGLLPKTVEIRGEFWIRRQTFDKINEELISKGEKPFANPRAVAAGTLKLKDPIEIAKRNLQFKPWQVVVPFGGGAGLSNSSYDLLKLCETAGFAQCDAELLQASVVRNRGFIEKKLIYYKQLKEGLFIQGKGMDTDGIVFKVDSMMLRKTLGNGPKYPNWAFCYKFPSERAQTTLRDVIWQVGTTGKVTPVAIYDPVNVGGTENKRANLTNYTQIANMELHVGATISVYKGGEIIPQVEGVVAPAADPKPIPEPTACPACGQPVTREVNEQSGIVTHYCTNPTCSGKIADQLKSLGGRVVLDIEGLGDQFVDKMVADGVITNIGDLWEWFTDMVKYQHESWFDDEIKASGYSPAQIKELLVSLQHSLTKPWEKWLVALNIPDIGAQLAKSLVYYLKLQPDDMIRLPEKLLTVKMGSVDGIGAARLSAIYDWCNSPHTLGILEKLYKAGVRPAAPVIVEGQKPLSGITFVITGEFWVDRETLTQALVNLGAVAKSGVSKKVNLLLVGSAPGRTKTTKAAELNIRKEGEIWVRNVLEENGIDLAGLPKNGGLDVDDGMIDDI